MARLAPFRGVQSDAALVHAARAGESASLGLLFERYRARLYATALKLTHSAVAAEDAVHDAFLTALTRLPELHDPAAVGGWLHAIVRNQCLMELRRQRAYAGAQETELHLDRLADEETLERCIESRDLRDWVWNALARMTEAYRTVVLLRYFGSYDSYEELAAILGVPVGTVRSRLYDAKARLAGLLLESAGLADDAPLRLVTQRHTFYCDLWGAFNRGERKTILAHFAEDLHLVFRAEPVKRGRRHFEPVMDDTANPGVKVDVRRTLASGNVTVLEGAFLNPPSDPQHCPPGFSFVLLGDCGLTQRLHIYHAPRPPQPVEG